MSKRTEMKEKVPMAKKHMKKYSLSLATKEMQIKAILNCYYQEHKQQQLVRMWRKRNPHTLLVGM
jgi:ABC-type proline/glycine betaine transport system substrate-binding protein